MPESSAAGAAAVSLSAATVAPMRRLGVEREGQRAG